MNGCYGDGENDHNGSGEGGDGDGDGEPRRFDFVGGVMLCIISGTCLLGFNRAGPWGWTSTPVVTMLGAFS